MAGGDEHELGEGPDQGVEAVGALAARKSVGGEVAHLALQLREVADVGDAGQGAIAARWNLTSTPTFYILDARGVIRSKWPAGASPEVIDTALDKLIKEVEVPR